jgi:hypothetical protein
MKDRTYESTTSEDEVCCIIGQAVIELTTACDQIDAGIKTAVDGRS